MATNPSLAVVAEWLRRLTRNQFPSGSVGSNPTSCVLLLSSLWFINVLEDMHKPELVLISSPRHQNQCARVAQSVER